MLHEDRDRVVREFRNGTTKILIATDVLSRGFDVSQVAPVLRLFDFWGKLCSKSEDSILSQRAL